MVLDELRPYLQKDGGLTRWPREKLTEIIFSALTFCNIVCVYIERVS